MLLNKYLLSQYVAEMEIQNWGAAILEDFLMTTGLIEEVTFKEWTLIATPLWESETIIHRRF